LAFAIGKKQMC